MTRQELRELVGVLASLERERSELKESLDAGRRAVEEAYLVANRDRYEALDDLADRIAELRATINDGALEVAEETGETSPVPGISIRSRTRLEYEESDAIPWALEVSRISGTDPAELLTVRRRPLEKLIRAHRPAFARIEVERTVAYSRDLPSLYGPGGETMEGRG